MEEIQKPIGRSITYKDARASCTFEYVVNEKEELIAPVLLTFCPIRISEHRKPCVIKIPVHFIQQLQTLPSEIQGCSIDVLIRCAHYIQNQEKYCKQQKEKENEAVCDSSLILPSIEYRL